MVGETLIAPSDLYIIIGTVKVNGHELRLLASRPSPDKRKEFMRDNGTLRLMVRCNCAYEVSEWATPVTAKEVAQRLIRSHMPNWKPRESTHFTGNNTKRYAWAGVADEMMEEAIERKREAFRDVFTQDNVNFSTFRYWNST